MSVPVRGTIRITPKRVELSDGTVVTIGEFTERHASEIGERLIALEKAVRGAAGDIFTSPEAPAFGGGVAGTPGTPGAPGAPGTPGATDHGALTGLLDDDHPQYVQHGEPVRALPHSHIINKLDDVDDVDAGAALDADVLFWYAARGKWVAAVTPDGNTGGSNTTGFGRNALQLNSGEYATAFGKGALTSNTADFCAGFGYYALSSNTGARSCAFGYTALQANTGADSSAFGHQALNNNHGAKCSAFGTTALWNNQGDKNTAIGYSSGYAPAGFTANANTTGANNTFLGAETGSDSPTQRSNSTTVGYQALHSASNQVVLGNAAVTEVQAGTGGVATVKCAAVNLNGTDLQAILDALAVTEQHVIATRMFGG